jgi:hypothetical protein
MTTANEVLTHNCIYVSVCTYSYRRVQLIQFLCHGLDILALYSQQVLFSNVLISYEAHPAFYSVVTGVISGGKADMA